MKKFKFAGFKKVKQSGQVVMLQNKQDRYITIRVRFDGKLQDKNGNVFATAKQADQDYAKSTAQKHFKAMTQV